jgi:hypothetical protein
MLSEMIIPLTSSYSPLPLLLPLCSPFVGETLVQENVGTEPAAVFCRSGDYLRNSYIGSGERKDCEIRTRRIGQK